MSGNSFDKKIKDKLYEHESDYDSGAWEKFKPMLPVPWYTSMFQNYAGWLFGGLATSALLFTFLYQNNKNNLLNGEISTLKQQLASIAKADTVFIEKNIVDTIYLTEYVEKYKYISIPKDQTIKIPDFEKEATESKENLLNEKASEQNLTNRDNEPSQSDLNDTEIIQNTNIVNDKSNETIVADTQKPSSVDMESTYERSTTPLNKNKLVEESANQMANSESKYEFSLPKLATLEQMPPTKSPKTQISADSANGIAAKPLVEEKPIKDTPDKQKKKINLPKMRLGIGSDYLGLNVLTNGLNAEVFIADKISLSTGVLFSGIRQTEHSMAKDFNNKTGKLFQKEFEKYNPRIKNERPDQIRDINIRTSFIKMPINFNYYINTWSRFNFMISAGTHLDLRVYQDIDYFSGPIGDLIKDRFEAKPSPKVLNSFNYGMGVQYKYGRIVGQVMPYFDFRFRETDYFIPKSRFGLSASLKYEFGK
jgi:hypothetical protein